MFFLRQNYITFFKRTKKCGNNSPKRLIFSSMYPIRLLHFLILQYILSKKVLAPFICIFTTYNNKLHLCRTPPISIEIHSVENFYKALIIN